MKKKGFTLVELLGVIVLLGILGLIVYPTIGKIINDNKQKLYDKQVSELERLTNTYLISNDTSYEDNVEKMITFEQLKNSGIISGSDIKNPKTGEDLNGCMTYKWLDASNQFEIRYSEDCVVKNPEQIELEVIFNTNSTPSNNWYNNDFYVNISINGASSYSWCGTTNSSCEPNSLVNSNTGSALISTESNTNIICIIAYDELDNYTAKICSSPYKLDKTGPTITGLSEIVVLQGQTVDLTTGVSVSDSLSGTDGTFTTTPSTVDTTNIGTQTVTYKAVDKAGNETTETRTIRVDEKLPEQIELVTTFGSTNSSNSNGWYKEDITASIEITGANSYKWCQTTSACEPNNLVNSNNGTVTINTESDSNIICIIAYDTEGNYTDKLCSDVYKLDKTKPEITGIEDIIVERNGNVDLRDGVSVSDNLSEIEGTFTVSPTSIDTSKVGEQTVTYTVTDKAGNTTTETRTIIVEGNAPVITFNPTTSANTNGWYKENFNVEINVTDDSGLGISSTNWCETIEENCNPTNNGTIATVTLESSNVKVCAQATDGSGKSTTTCSDTYKLDKTLPYFTGISDETIQKGETFDVRNGVTVNDALSLIDGDYSVSPSSVDTSKAGTTILTYSALDKAGNLKEITRTIVVDADGPSISYEVTASPNSNGWYNSTFFVNINVTDNSGTGINNTKWCGTLDNTCTPTTSGTTAQVSLEGSSTRICAQSTDNNNKTSEVICSDGYKLDITAPSKPSITGGSNSYVTSASISLSTASTDTTSGGITYEYYVTNSSDSPTTSTTATGTYTSPMTFNTNRAGDYMYVRAKDQAGNRSEWSDVQRLYIDINNPTISAKGNSYTITEGDSNEISSTYFNIDKNGNASISSTVCTSNIDGTVSNTSSLSVGTHTVTCTVTKSTNKTANASTTIIVESAGVTADDLKTNIVTTGDGLYLDSDGIYRYKGANPNNYIMLGTEEYQIMAIEPQGIKVIRSDNYTDIAFDTDRPNSTNTYSGGYGYNNIWSPANEISQNGVVSDTITNGSKSGTVTTPSTAYTYLHDTYYSNLSSVDKYIVKNATWNVGPVTKANTMLLSTIKEEEDNWTWSGKIGLMTLSEYIQAQSPSSSGYSSCSSNVYQNTSCGTDNWLKKSYIWTINPRSNNTFYMWNVYSDVNVASRDAYYICGLRPVVYLSSDIKLSGSGTSGQPFTIIG